MEANWYCLYTKPKKERYVAENLSTQLGLETYLPQLRQTRVIRRVRRLVTEPVFPRYLFCRFALGDHLRWVRHSPDVLSIVCHGEQPTAIPGATVEQIKAWASEAALVPTSRPALKAGDRVRITAAPMLGLEAIFQEYLDKSDRVSLLLDLMNTYAKLVLPREQVEPCAQC